LLFISNEIKKLANSTTDKVLKNKLIDLSNKLKNLSQSQKFDELLSDLKDVLNPDAFKQDFSLTIN